MPERFGNTNHNKTTFGQSSVRLNWKVFHWVFLMKIYGGDPHLEIVL